MIPKPKHCNQDWLKMEKTEDGRICGQCENLMVDFTRMSWNEIEKVHAENPGQCGMYSQRQLNHWGYEPPSIFSECSKIAIVFSSLFAGISFQSAEAKPLNIQKEAIHFSPVEMRTDSIPEKKDPLEIVRPTILLKGLIVDANTKEPLEAKLLLSRLPRFRLWTGIDGVLQSRLSKDIFLKQDTFKIESRGFHTLQMPIAGFINKFPVVKLEPIKNYQRQVHIISYGVPEPTPTQKIKSGVKNILRKKD